MSEKNNTFEQLAINPSGRILGIDYGAVRIGLAITDPSQSLASPLTVYTRRSATLDEVYFHSLVKAEQVVGIVIGLPLYLSGDPSPKSKEAEAFGQWLHDITQLPVQCFDERFTTAFARDALNESQLSGKKRKARLDKIAAQILLTAFLESRQNRSSCSLGDSLK